MPSRDAMPKQITPAHIARRRNLIVIGVLIAAALTGPIATLMAVQARAHASDALATTQAEGDVIHRAFAQAAAHRWAYGEGELLTTSGAWEDDAGRPRLDADLAADWGVSGAYTQTATRQGDLGARHVVWESVSTVATGERLLELHRFLVMTDNGMLYLTVPVTETDGSPPMPALGGNPTVEPYLVDPRLVDTPAADWPVNMPRRNTPTNVAAVVTEWADAYATDDQRALFRLSGDTNDTLTYRGLGGFTVAELSIGQSAERGDWLLTRATLTLTNTYGVVIRSDYDLLIGDHGDPVPRIVAWGPRGAGPTLTPRQQAVPAGTAPLGGYGTRSADPQPSPGPSHGFVDPPDDEPDSEPDDDDDEVAP